MNRFFDRRRSAKLAILLVLLALAGLAPAASQPPEEEDPKAAKPGKKVVPEDEVKKPLPPKKVPIDDPAPKPSTPDRRLEELDRAAADTSSPELKALFKRFAVPHDRLTDPTGTHRIKLIPLYRTEVFPKEFGVADLDADDKPQPVRNVLYRTAKIEHFEELAIDAVDGLMKNRPMGVSVADQTTACELLLTAVSRFHAYACEKGFDGGATPIRRNKKAWKGVRKTLTLKLRDVRLMKLAVVNGSGPVNWPGMRETAMKLLAEYPGDATVVKEVGAVRLKEIELLLASPDQADHVAACGLLDELDDKMPGVGGEVARKGRQQLAKEAEAVFRRAKEKKDVGDFVAARDLLARAEGLHPNMAGLRDLQRELKTGYAILYVGVRQLPERMSPATARWDSERQAVELLFEGLLEEVPGEKGEARYVPGVAQGMPTVVTGGRELRLRSMTREVAGTAALDVNDVVGTAKLLGCGREPATGRRPESWAAAGLEWFDDLPTPTVDGGLRIGFRPMHPDPRALLIFKILPARYLAQTNKLVDDPEFATRPVGSGPYRVHSIPGMEGREVVFTDNPAYSKSRDRAGLPRLREVRMVDATKIDPVVEFREDRLHLLTDVPTRELDRFLGPASGLGDKIKMVTAVSNRRVQVLAINHRRTPLQNKEFRRGLMLAIDREAILGSVFRGGKPEFARYHRAMTGPFPPTSWATPRGEGGKTESLTNRDLAVAKLRAYLETAGAKTEISLLYPSDNPSAANVATAITKQVDDLFKTVSDGKKLTIIPEPVPLADFFRRVTEEHRYDLAYTALDYPDDWHPYGLGEFLDPTATGGGGRNTTGYLGPDSNPDAEDLRFGQLLREVRNYRDFKGELVPRARDLHRHFNGCVPFIPLWQLDRHTVVHSSLKVFVDETPEPINPALLNPTLLFQGVARWRLE